MISGLSEMFDYMIIKVCFDFERSSDGIFSFFFFDELRFLLQVICY